METRRLGTSDVQITPILMGTWQAGKSMWVGIELSNDQLQEIDAIGRQVTDHLDNNPVMWDW